jgi:hypothetical protein
MNDFRDKFEVFAKEIEFLLEKETTTDIREKQLNEFDFKLRDREKRLDGKLEEISKKEAGIIQQKVYTEKLNEQYNKNNQLLDRKSEELKLREEACGKREEEIKQAELKLDDKKNGMMDAEQKEVELKKRELMVQKEIEIDRERKEVLSIKEKQLIDKEVRLQRFSQA